MISSSDNVPELAAAVAQSSNNTVEFDEVDNVRWDDVTLWRFGKPNGWYCERRFARIFVTACVSNLTIHQSLWKT